MGKKEKYLKYIITDMISKTMVDNVGGFHGIMIKLPFEPRNEWTTDSSLYPKLIYPSRRLREFGDYIERMYGSNEEEVRPLFNSYINILKGIVDEA